MEWHLILVAVGFFFLLVKDYSPFPPVTFILVVFNQNSLCFHPIPAFGAVSGALRIHIYFQTTPEFTSIKSKPVFLGGPEFPFFFGGLNRAGVNAL